MSDCSSGCGSSNMSTGSDSDLEYNISDDMNIHLVDSDPESDRASNFSDDLLLNEDTSSTDENNLNEQNASGSENENTGMDTQSNSNEFYFEGVEKLLEIWFARLDGKYGENCTLRRIPRYQLEEMLKLVHCEIIDSASNDDIDSYVLSESSLFVSQRRIILKTCGTTTPLQCLKFLWTLVKDYTGLDCIEDVYYSHKNYKRPHVQKLPYRKFDNEVSILDDFFQGVPGSAYCLGSMNRDCWYLYTYHAPISAKHGMVRLTNSLHHLNHHGHNHHHHHLHGKKKRRAGSSSAGSICKGQQTLGCSSMLMPLEPDQTLEILMNDLDQNVMDIFTQKSCKTAEEATLKSGIHRIIPGMIINDHLFEPCGYSMNGIIKDKDPSRSKNRNGTYMTIHITPESKFSYVSFETNIALSSYKDVICRVLEVFRPGKFVLTFFANKASKGYHAHQEMNQMDEIKDQWLRMDNQFCRLKKNDLTYAMYTKFPS